MRLLHTSDWHLGKRLCDWPLLEDQARALEQLFQVCRAEGVDALVVAGDLFDRAVPPEDAVALLSDFFTRVARDLGIPVVAVSGNHDSAERLGFLAGIAERVGVHVRTAFDRRAEAVVVEARGKRARIFCLPYLEPEVARARLGDESLRGHDAAVRAALAAMRAQRAAAGGEEAVLVGHLFAQGGRESADSERPLVVGGAAQVAVDALDGWSYVALGHLHAPQAVGGREDVRYSGSLLKYSFGEAEQDKGVTLVELAGGRATARHLPLAPRRDLVRVEGSFDELLHDPRFAAAEGAYVQATYTDRAYLIDVARRLRARFPYLLSAQAAALLEPEAGEAAVPAAVPRDGRELLAGFWKHVEPGGEPGEEQLAAFERALAAEGAAEPAAAGAAAEAGS